MPDFVPVAKTADIPNETSVRVDLNGRKIALFHVGDNFYAVDDTCTHEEASLSEGTLYLDEDEPQVECPKHGATFEISTGQVLTLPAVKSVRGYETKVDGDTVLVATEPKS
ncbi:MAG TPA: non-heme iron oxygenase ferredoxin subunit [Chloroflexota bacterium]|jgi:NAD(P)H-dependent nitrite reductase small subunit